MSINLVISPKQSSFFFFITLSVHFLLLRNIAVKNSVVMVTRKLTFSLFIIIIIINFIYERLSSHPRTLYNRIKHLVKQWQNKNNKIKAQDKMNKQWIHSEYADLNR